MQYDLKRLIRKSQIKLKKVVSPRSSLLRPTHNLLIIANVITQAQISKKGPNKNSLLCKCSYTAFSRFFILIWFAAVKLLLLVITTPYIQQSSCSHPGSYFREIPYASQSFQEFRELVSFLKIAIITLEHWLTTTPKLQKGTIHPHRNSDFMNKA